MYGLDWRRSLIVIIGTIFIIWQGGSAIDHIRELYDGLCPVQGPGTAYYKNGSCVGISGDLETLGTIMAVAVICFVGGAILWWRHTDSSLK